MDIILAVDTDMYVHIQQKNEWAKYGIRNDRVDTMHDAIIRISEKEKFLFIVINEDSIPDFMTQLPIMRDVTSDLIFVITSSYSVSKFTNALGAGADIYGPFADCAHEDVYAGIEILKNRSKGFNEKSLSVLVGNDIILSKSRSIAFIKDVELSLTKKEFGILKLLMENKGKLVTYTEILQAVWKNEEINSSDVVWRTVNRLREKLGAAKDAECNCIKTEHAKGYKFL